MTKYLRIHLSTALIVMIAASGLLWLNVRTMYYEDVFWVAYDKLEMDKADPLVTSTKYMLTELAHSRLAVYGWPFKLKDVYIHRAERSFPETGVELSPDETAALFRLNKGPLKGANAGSLPLDAFLTAAPILKNRVAYNWNTATISDEGRWSLRGIFYDAMVLLGALGVVAFGCEWFVRRKSESLVQPFQG